MITNAQELKALDEFLVSSFKKLPSDHRFTVGRFYTEDAKRAFENPMKGNIKIRVNYIIGPYFTYIPETISPVKVVFYPGTIEVHAPLEFLLIKELIDGVSEIYAVDYGPGTQMIILRKCISDVRVKDSTYIYGIDGSLMEESTILNGEKLSFRKMSSWDVGGNEMIMTVDDRYQPFDSSLYRMLQRIGGFK